jgi:hypothetical protein
LLLQVSLRWAVGAPDLVFVSRSFQPIIVKCFDYSFDRVSAANSEVWRIDGSGEEADADAPHLVVEDLSVDIQTRFARTRQLRESHPNSGSRYSADRRK